MSVAPEFSRPFRVDRIGTDGREITFSANADERRALAKRFDLVELPSLTGKARLRRMAGGMYRLDADFEADAVQTCVVTLEPLPVHVAENFTMTFAPEEKIERSSEVVIGDEEDPPEPLLDGSIDIGEAVAEHLSLALDPFPRKPSAEVDEAHIPSGTAEERPHPFAALAELKKRLGN